MEYHHLVDTGRFNGVDSDDSSLSSDDEEDKDLASRCCMFLCICPWNLSSVKKALQENGIQLRCMPKRLKQKEQLSVQPFHEPNFMGSMKPFYVNPRNDDDDLGLTDMKKSYGTYPYHIIANQQAFPMTQRFPVFESSLGSSAWETGRYTDTNVLSKLVVEVYMDTTPCKWILENVRPRAKIFVRVATVRSPWFLWKDQVKFYCVFGTKMNPNSSKVLFVTVKQRKQKHYVRLIAGDEPANTVKAVNDGRFFKLIVTHKAPYSHFLQHVMTKKYLSIEVKSRKKSLTLVTDVEKATSWSFKIQN